jgi:hypothetical protein
MGMDVGADEPFEWGPLISTSNNAPGFTNKKCVTKFASSIEWCVREARGNSSQVAGGADCAILRQEQLSEQSM